LNSGAQFDWHGRAQGMRPSAHECLVPQSTPVCQKKQVFIAIAGLAEETKH